MNGILCYLKHCLLTELLYMTLHIFLHSISCFGRSPQLQIDLILGQIEPSKHHSYLQFVQDAHKQLQTSYAITNQHLQAQYLRQKRYHTR